MIHATATRYSYIDGADDLWGWMGDEGYGGEERVSLLLSQLFVPHQVHQQYNAVFRPTHW